MTDTTITSANSVLTLVAPSLFPAPVQIEGYSTDRAIVTGSRDIAEVQMGVDGRMTAGYVPMPVQQTITLQADSPSRTFFTTLVQSMITAKEIFYLTGNLVLPATGESFALTRGVINNTKQIPDAMKVLQPVDIQITWQSVDPSIV